MPKITKRTIDGLRSQLRDGDVFAWDSEMPGFGVRLRVSGKTSFIVQYRNRHGTSRRVTLGRFGVLTAEEARIEARKALAEVARGGDPAEDRVKARQDCTIAELCALYLDEGPAAKPNKKSWSTDASIFRRHVVPLIGRKYLRALSKLDIERFQRDVTEGKTADDVKTSNGRAIVKGGPGIATRAVAALSAMLSWAVDRGLRPDNPARGVKLKKGRKVERFLSAAEMARLGDTLAAAEVTGTNPTAVAAIRLLLFTGCRKSEILGLKWEWIDWEHGVLRLPDSKTGAKVVPLGTPALDLLVTLPRRPNCPWVLPAGQGRAGHLVGLRGPWMVIAKTAGLDDVRLHDLRHSFASVGAASGASLFLLGKVLGHTQPSTTERYAHLSADPVREVADYIARRIDAAMRGEGTPPRQTTAR